MGRTLQTLTIDLTANTANFSAAMTKAQQISLSSTRNIAKSFALVGSAAAAMGVAVAGAVAGLVAKADQYVTQIERMAEKTGQSTEEISKLAYAATLSGSNLDDLGGLLMKFNRSATESAEGNKKAEAAFKALGVSVTDSQGRFKPAGPLLEEVIGKLNLMPNSVKKTATEMDLFGRSGAQLAPTLKLLGANAAQTEADMKNFGLVVGKDTAEASERLAQTMERGKMALTGLSVTVLTAAVPALQILADKVMALASNGQLVSFAQRLGDDVAKAARLASDALQFMSDHAGTLRKTLEALIALEVASWLVSINTRAVTAAGGIDTLITAIGKAVLRMSGLTGIVTALGAAATAAWGTITALAALAAEEGVVATATFAMQMAWDRFTLAVIRNPLGAILAGVAASFLLIYRGMNQNIAATAKAGDAAVEWGDKWQAVIANASDALSGFKKLLLSFSVDQIKAGVQQLKDIPTIGERVHQVANSRAASAPKPAEAPAPPPAPPLPKPTPQPAKPDPYKEELAKLNQELANSQLALNAAMQDSVDAQRAATEAGKSGLIITELQNKLKRQLTATEKAAISNPVRDTGENEHNVQVVESLRQRTQASQDALSTTQALTRVIGQGPAAEEAAREAVEASTLAREIGVAAAAKYADRLSQLQKFQEQAARAARELETAQQAFSLNQDAADTDALAQATLRGAAAVEQETLQLKLQAIVRAHRGDDAATTQKLIDATVAQAAAEKNLRAVQEGKVYTSPLAQYQQAIADINRLARDAKAAGVEVDQTQVWMANRDAALKYQEALERIHAVTGTVGDGVRDFFTDMRNQTLSAATMVHEVLSQAFEGLNDNLARMLTGQKTAWASFFRGIAESIAKMGLQKLEQSVVSAIMGPEKQKSDPALATTNSKLDMINATLNTINSSIQAGGGGFGGGTGSGDDDEGIGDSTGDDSGGSSTPARAGGWFGKLLGGAAGLFGKILPLFAGHMALGGNVQAGMAYDVGEQGRETFVPHTNGSIIPNNRLGGQTPEVHVHVANGVTKEEMKMHTAEMLRQWHPQVVRDAVSAFRSDAQRRPGASR